MKTLTLSIVGAGSSYTPELIEGILQHDPETLPVGEIRFHDLDLHRLSVMAGLAERMVRKQARDIRIISTPQLEPGVAGADFVITQIRVGGMAARHLDETLPLKYGIIGQETTGPGGMFKALRTIPPMIEIGRTVERVAPQAFILNYTNPSGIITEAVTKHTHARLIGLCSGIPLVQNRVQTWLTPRYGPVQMRSVGLNHLGFIYRIEAHGQDVTMEAIEWLIDQKRRHPESDGPEVSWMESAAAVGAIPMWGYSGYFLYRRRLLAEQQAKPNDRATVIAGLERQLFEEAARPETQEKPAVLNKRGGGGYSAVTFAVLKAILGNTGDQIVASTPNHGAVEGIPDDASVELTCRFDRNGATPLPVGPLPLAFRGLVQAVKAYESLTVEAAIRREKRLVIQAFLNHPLAGDLTSVRGLVDEMLHAHGMTYR